MFDNNPVYWSDPSGADSKPSINLSFQGDEAVQWIFNILVSIGTYTDKHDEKAALYGFDSFEEFINFFRADKNPESNNDGSADGNGAGVEDNIYIDTKGKRVKVENTGDNFDRIFIDGKEVLATKRGLLGNELRQIGYNIEMIGPQGVGMGLTDFILDVYNIISGAILVKRGITIIGKKSVGERVVLGASEGSLESTYFFVRTLGINKTMPTRLPVIIGPPTKNLGIFLGRNSVLIGTLPIGMGVYGRTQ